MYENSYIEHQEVEHTVLQGPTFVTHIAEWVILVKDVQ